MTRRAARVDANQALIVDALRAAGASVLPIHRVGADAPDLLVGFRAKNFLMEVKPVGKKLRPRQAVWFTLWQGQACVAHTAEEALRSIGALA